MVVTGTPEDGKTASEPAVSTGVVMAKPEAARLAGLAGKIPEKIELALGAAVIKEFPSG